MIIKSEVSFCILLFFTINIFAQNEGSITGVVKDESNNSPIEFVNVLLQKNLDSSRVEGTVTNKKGKFSFANIEPGEYFIKLSFIGYKEKIIPLIKINSPNRILDIGTVLLRDTSVTLEEVLDNISKDFIQ